jgi:uncharacterized protein YggE
MKTLISTLAVGCISALCAFGGESQIPHITVYGTATTEVIPNQMKWFLRVENRGPGLDSVATEHTAAVSLVLGLLKKSKVEESSIQTSRMEFGENWEYRSSSRVREGYIASTQIYFKMTDFEGYTPLWSALSKLNTVSISSVAYDHSQRIQYQNETREKAAAAAREKAKALARALETDILEPLEIEEDMASIEPWAGNRMLYNSVTAANNAAQDQSTALAPGTIPITIRVKVTFRLSMPKK